MWLTMWPVTWPTEANENTRVARGTLSAITVGSSKWCTGPKFRAAAPNIVADKNFSVVLDLFSTSGPNLVALAWTGDELSRGQAQNGVNFEFEVKFDLEGQSQSPPKTIGILTKVFYAYGPNLVILADTGHELSRGQARDWRTDGRTHTQTDAGNDNTRRPILASGKNHKLFVYWPKIQFSKISFLRDMT